MRTSLLSINQNSVTGSNKYRNWGRFITGIGLATAAFVLVQIFVIHTDASKFDRPGVPTTQILKSAQVIEAVAIPAADRKLPTLDTLKAKSVDLPHIVKDKESQSRLYEIPFEIPSKNVPFGLCILRAHTIESIWVDGTLLQLKPWVSYGQQFRANPLFQSLILGLTQGKHQLQIVMKSNPSTPSGLSEIWLGENQVISRACAQLDGNFKVREAAGFYLMLFISALALASSLILKGRLFWYFWLFTAVWLLNRGLLNTSQFDMENPLWSAAYYITRPLITMPLLMFCLQIIGKLDEKNFWRTASFFLLGYTAFFLTPSIYWNEWLLVFGSICLILIIIVCSRVMPHVMRLPGYSSTAISAALAFSILANFSDILRGFGFLSWAQGSLSAWSIPIICIGVSLFIAEKLNEHINLQEQAAEHLRSEIKQVRLNLESQFRKSHIETEKIAIFEERKRILREMHDGLGTQLVSASALVRNTSPDNGALSELIDNAIQELRIFLDVLSTTTDAKGRHSGKDLNVLLAKLRQHIEPVLRAKQIVLEWDLEEIPDGFVPSDRSRINLLRLVQEALTNAVKHAHTQQITIRARTLRSKLVIEVIDQGVGLSTQAVEGHLNPGYGIKNMRKRAALIGAELIIKNGAPGTVVQIILSPQRDSESDFVAETLT